MVLTTLLLCGLNRKHIFFKFFFKIIIVLLHSIAEYYSIIYFTSVYISTIILLVIVINFKIKIKINLDTLLFVLLSTSRTRFGFCEKKFGTSKI